MKKEPSGCPRLKGDNFTYYLLKLNKINIFLTSSASRFIDSTDSSLSLSLSVSVCLSLLHTHTHTHHLSLHDFSKRIWIYQFVPHVLIKYCKTFQSPYCKRIFSDLYDNLLIDWLVDWLINWLIDQLIDFDNAKPSRDIFCLYIKELYTLHFFIYIIRVCSLYFFAYCYKISNIPIWGKKI